MAKIASSLGYLATARQGQIDTVTLDVYCNELKDFPIDEIVAAIRDLAKTPRAQGETAVPDLGTVLSAVRYAGRFRVTREAMEEREHEDRHRAEHPEEYIAVRDVFAEVMTRKKIAALPSKPVAVPAQPLPTCCPSCGGALPWEGTLSTLSAADHRALADAIDRLASK